MGKSKELSIEALGRVLSAVGVYEILCNERYGVHAELSAEFVPSCNSFGFAVRYNKEASFHKNFWELLKDVHVSSELLKEVLFLLCSFQNVSSATLAEDLDRTVANKR